MITKLNKTQVPDFVEKVSPELQIIDSDLALGPEKEFGMGEYHAMSVQDEILILNDPSLGLKLQIKDSRITVGTEEGSIEQEIAYLSDITEGGGGISSINTNNGLEGGPITTSGTIGLKPIGGYTLLGRAQPTGGIPEEISSLDVNIMLGTIHTNRDTEEHLVQTLHNSDLVLDSNSTLGIEHEDQNYPMVLLGEGEETLRNVEDIEDGQILRGDYIIFDEEAVQFLGFDPITIYAGGRILLEVRPTTGELYSEFGINSFGHLTLLYNGTWKSTILYIPNDQDYQVSRAIEIENLVEQGLDCVSTIKHRNTAIPHLEIGDAEFPMVLHSKERIYTDNGSLAYLSDVQQMPWMNTPNSPSIIYPGTIFHCGVENNSSVWEINTPIDSLTFTFQPNCLYPIIVRFTTGENPTDIHITPLPDQNLLMYENLDAFSSKSPYEMVCINNVVHWNRLIPVPNHSVPD